VQGLLFYDPSAGQGEFYRTDGQGGIARTRLHVGWRSSWTHIIPGKFGGSNFTDLLFYDSAGTAEFYTTDAQGRIALLKEHPGWVSAGGLPWKHIIPGQFGGSNFTDLLFYDGAGSAAFYTSDGQGGIALLREHPGWVSAGGLPWTHIIPGQFGGSGVTDLLFYDGAGSAAFYTSDGQGGIALLKEHPGWVSAGGLPWKHIIPGQFGGNSSVTDLLFYDGAGSAAFYTSDGQGGIALLREHPGWVSPANLPWTHIIPGQFGGSGVTDLLFYDSAGSGAFYTSDGQGRIALLSETTEWRSSWTRIIPGDFAQTSLRVDIHVKSLLPITNNINQFIDTQFFNMQELFATVGINVSRETTEDLSNDPNLQPLQNLDIGECRGTPTQDQITLFAQRNNVGNNELVIYICSTLLQMGAASNVIGCATHPVGQPGAAVVQNNAKWLTAHEVGHVLDLQHVCKFPTTDNPNPPVPCAAGHMDSLMFPNTSWTNVPPDLSADEESTMRNSDLTITWT
jgi:hypothetical protein